MNNLTQVLSEEHQNILKVIGAIKKECQLIEDGQTVDQEFFKTAIDFIRNYADRWHHAKEEDILFKAMCQDEVAMHCNPVDQMLHEHDLGRDYIKNLETSLSNNNIKEILTNARGYAFLLADHIFKEDNILYPMADQVLSKDQQAKIKQEFRQVETDKFGPEVKDKYLNIVKTFEAR